MKVWAIFYRVPFFTDYRLHGESERDMPTRSIKNNGRKLSRSRAAYCSTTLRRPLSRCFFLSSCCQGETRQNIKMCSLLPSYHCSAGLDTRRGGVGQDTTQAVWARRMTGRRAARRISAVLLYFAVGTTL